jgi:undecaprenyl diphosphate synthase
MSASPSTRDVDPKVSVNTTETQAVVCAARGLDPQTLPRHVAIVMDGNGRWAQARGLPRIEGHRRGVGTVQRIVEECSELGLEQITLYCFSTENWKRPLIEQRLLMTLLEQYLVEERGNILRQNLRFAVIGRRAGLSDGVLQEMAVTEECARENTGTRLCLAVNYGSRSELVDAARTLALAVQAGQLKPDDIDETRFGQALYTAGMSDPDLVVRTAGELRISNFLLWQLSYAEFWVTSKCWPEFTTTDLHEAFRDFARRDRRFGGLNPPLASAVSNSPAPSA